MKKLIIISMLMLMAVTTMAQEQARQASLNERFYQAKLRELVYRLHITSEQQKKFEPIYRSYCEEMTALWNDRKRPIKPSTSSDAAAMAKRKMEMQQRAQGIRMKYIDKFATVLNAHQVDRFFEVESAIQKKLKERRDQARGQ
ncbi:MAG: hypothetical protein IJV05_11050 [Muribaculaceae bacterium]|nr:hypothetical protein [Muribaculaceae bacterium]